MYNSFIWFCKLIHSSENTTLAPRSYIYTCMRTSLINATTLLFLLCSTQALAQQKDYLYYVKTHCDNLIAHGQDTYGDQSNHMLASVIDTRDMSVPQAKVPPTEGTRAHDRAVGGSNFYHDVETIKLFDVLSAITGDEKYENAAQAYATDFLKYCQNPHTGLLAWGEHLYYNFYADSVMVGDLENPRKDIYHEFLAETPPWDYLWKLDTSAVRKAIAGVKYHFRSPTTQSFLFNRHAYWEKIDRNEYRGLAQYQVGGQPWIKHSGLQAYSFAFLYNKTGNAEWKKWAEGSGSLYCNYRNPETNLTVSCIDDPRPIALYPNLSQTALLSYYLLKAGQLHADFNHLQQRAETLLQAAERYSWNKKQASYQQALYLNGTPYGNEFIPVIFTGYGSSDIIQFGRIAAYFCKTTNDEAYRTMVSKVADLILETTWPDSFVINSLGAAAQFSLDAYEILEDDRLLAAVQGYADIGIEKLWSGQLFVRQPGDPYYEAKLGTSQLVAALLRLHLLENRAANRQKSAEAAVTQWSF